ncbi:2Fe-2S iron-sulfur cluster-binding protein [Zhongshania aquimaris]|uniref:2Fe-2S iron-sulfur cluster binding domain-containing protein n=1 Tax=Zhongshania aquimaris TaxID=2857107 RepID=A0ABS6VYF6_9GAMM|nr:2Fe-2S iron-sulfur cluster-binding protein [Zhongshania aquimaris]MBW2942715.1 2Fe-2S iron-sulfur cluster binding domain-containing protein [Zhongshania aquimaris]
MAKVKYISFTGEFVIVDVGVGENLMQAALDNNVSGILGDCGGGCACATCHCIVGEGWGEEIGEPSGHENDLLDGLLERSKRSRLSCQLIMSQDLDGLEVHLPETQF